MANSNTKSKKQKIGSSVIKKFIFQRFKVSFILFSLNKLSHKFFLKAGTPSNEICEIFNEFTLQPILIIMENGQIEIRQKSH